jgi:hypothetical protein
MQAKDNHRQDDSSAEALVGGFRQPIVVYPKESGRVASERSLMRICSRLVREENVIADGMHIE